MAGVDNFGELPVLLEESEEWNEVRERGAVPQRRRYSPDWWWRDRGGARLWQVPAEPEEPTCDDRNRDAGA